jgi:hypothetical protein
MKKKIIDNELIIKIKNEEKLFNFYFCILE